MTARLPDLVQLLPHRPPMLLLDELVEANATSAVAHVAITEKSLFLVDGGVPAIVMIEYMAQTIAAYVGMRDVVEGRPVQVGFLVACRQASFDVDQVVPGDELRVEARLQWSSDKVGQFECNVQRQGAQIAQATVSVYRGPLDGAEVE